ncbi:MAG: DUF72 domain-containing protein [Melioribacteraceae bacterium]|nr:DUF72 domain-containing protein [Melioribacteraceae bacterium]MCF8356126.1 DUF72 domain-containing protein [Melioribacteraceae bacterium]MCF8395908.1 DUF72 domain-containing protein [Melioribacteraceae bacterium]MCF8420985.1 DUF72 domain-containing protein [Melioribacteraceae bacterium]
MAKLHIGTCSWKYDSWRGIVYSDVKKINYLKEYSEHYNTVEIDQWFWSLFGDNKISMPHPNVVNSYKNSVNDDFHFTIKIPNSVTLTHYYQKSKNMPLIANKHFLSKELFDEFLTSIAPIEKQTASLMFQFEYLNKQKMPSQHQFLVEFQHFLDNYKSNFKFGVEIRNSNYLNRDYFEFLRENKLSHVFLQGYYMPDVTGIYKKYKDLITGKTIVRLHGPDRRGIEKKTGGDWSKIVEPKDNELHRIADMIADLLSREVDVYLNINNHYEGSAPLTIERIKTILEIE